MCRISGVWHKFMRVRVKSHRAGDVFNGAVSRRRHSGPNVSTAVWICLWHTCSITSCLTRRPNPLFVRS